MTISAMWVECPECHQGKCINCTEQVLGTDDQWYACPCAHPMLATYAGTTGHSGTDTSRERAERETTDGTAGERARGVLNYVHNRGYLGATVKELRDRFPDWHHGQISSALTNLHRAGGLARLSDKRDRCKVYVHPDFVGDRTREMPGRNRSSTGLAEAWDEGYAAGLDFGYAQAQDTYDGPSEDPTPNPYRPEQ